MCHPVLIYTKVIIFFNGMNILIQFTPYQDQYFLSFKKMNGMIHLPAKSRPRYRLYQGPVTHLSLKRTGTKDLRLTSAARDRREPFIFSAMSNTVAPDTRKKKQQTSPPNPIRQHGQMQYLDLEINKSLKKDH